MGDEIALIKPPIIYLGNKYRFLDKILPLIHPNRTFVEPFVGSGAVYLNSSNENVIINDLNKDIIDLHNHLRYCFPELIKEVEKICNKKHDNAETYYLLRDKFNNLGSCIEKTAIFIYINYYGYKGLIRYSSSGKLNVPYCQGFSRIKYSAKRLYDAHNYMSRKKIELHSRDFRDFLTPQSGVTALIDPPYLPSDGKEHCEGYLGLGFGLKDHQDIVEMAETYRKLGSTAIVCNHLTDVTRDLYKNADRIIELNRVSGVQHSSKVEIQKECLAVYGRPWSEKKKL